MNINVSKRRSFRLSLFVSLTLRLFVPQCGKCELAIQARSRLRLFDSLSFCLLVS